MSRLMKGVDPVVFWGAVGISLAFSLWGIIGTESLGAVMGSILSWFLANFGWGFILISAAALLLSVFFMLSPRYGQHPAGARRQPAGILHGVVGRDDVRGGPRARADVLRHLRADHALLRAAPR